MSLPASSPQRRPAQLRKGLLQRIDRVGTKDRSEPSALAGWRIDEEDVWTALPVETSLAGRGKELL
jgi:hypothetical protein